MSASPNCRCVVLLLVLNDKIADAGWLSESDKKMLQRNIDADSAQAEDHWVAGAFRNLKVWILIAAYFGFIMGLYGIGFWLPSLIKAAGVADTTTIGLLAAAGIALIALERR